MINRLVIASNNSAKTREIVAVFATFGMTAVNYRELMPEKTFPAETTDDQFENALVKARFIQQFLPDEFILADDTGAFFAAFPDKFGLTIARDFKAMGFQSMQEEDDYLLGLYEAWIAGPIWRHCLFCLRRQGPFIRVLVVVV